MVVRTERENIYIKINYYQSLDIAEESVVVVVVVISSPAPVFSFFGFKFLYIVPNYFFFFFYFFFLISVICRQASPSVQTQNLHSPTTRIVRERPLTNCPDGRSNNRTCGGGLVVLPSRREARTSSRRSSYTFKRATIDMPSKKSLVKSKGNIKKKRSSIILLFHHHLCNTRPGRRRTCLRILFFYKRIIDRAPCRQSTRDTQLSS